MSVLKVITSRKNDIFKILISVLLIGFSAACGGGGGGSSNKNGSGDECRSNSTCPVGEFCNFKDFSCGNSILPGACQTIPTSLVDCNVPPVIDPNDEPDPSVIAGPVCSCDRLTFNNQCWAEKASQSISGAGECP